MAEGRVGRHYVVLGAEAPPAAMHAAPGHDRYAMLEGHLRSGLTDFPTQVTACVQRRPFHDWELVLEDGGHRHRHAVERIYGVAFNCPDNPIVPHDLIGGIRSHLENKLTDYRDLGADLPIALTEYWSPAEATDPLFGNRWGAERLMGVDYLRRQEGVSGQGVNVVVVDQGVDKELVQRLGGTFGGGWTRQPYAEPGETKGGHGAMLVSNVLSVAPDATIFDCPLVPEEIPNIHRFLSHAHAAYCHMLAGIAHLRRSDPGRWSGPWIFLNAWATFDRGEEHPAGDYTNNPNHPFNRVIERTVDSGFDVVYAAGNCGQFRSSRQCGPCDQGPGQSILGANSHPKVLSVGAVRADGMWLGYSSQGPGQPRLCKDKPDLCAASQFAENDDAYVSNTGTSAASALAAGVVAALRSRWDARVFSPDELKMLLMEKARKTEGPEWNGRLGNGILDAAAAFDEAARRKPD